MNPALDVTRRLAILIFLCLLLPISSISSTVYVAPGGLDTNDGFDWTTAKKTIQAGIAAASFGDEVWVSAGTYNQRVVLKDGVALYGGFQGNETSLDQRNFLANICKIDAQKAGSAVTVPEGAGLATAIDGFTIANGAGTPQGDTMYGGGIYALNASVTVRNNVIASNRASQGAGIYCNGAIQLSGNTLQGNIAVVFGGGALLLFGPVTIEGNTVVSNRAVDGGGLALAHASGLVTSNTFQANFGQVGGGIHTVGAHPLISGNTFVSNTGYFGSGISCNAGTGVITGNRFSLNTAYLSGAGVYVYSANTSSISNNVFTGGSAQYGGAVASNRSNPRIVNNTMVGNSASVGGGGVAFVEEGKGVVSNNIIAFGASGLYRDPLTLPVARTNAFFGNTGPEYQGFNPGAGDVLDDPDFVDRAAGDYRLLEGSSCIDAGTNQDAPASDFQGTERPLDGDASGVATADIGAFESPALAPVFDMNVGDVKGSLPDGTMVGFSGVRVTALLPAQGIIYVQSADRSAGIRVISSQAFLPGQALNVTGVLLTDSSTGERAVAAIPGSPVAAGDAAEVAPLSIGLDDLGGMSAGLQSGISGAISLNNVGLLVSVWGKVTFSDLGGVHFTISDGVRTLSGDPVTDPDGHEGVRVALPPGCPAPAVGEYVRVHGISSICASESNLYRLLLMPGGYTLLSPGN